MVKNSNITAREIREKCNKDIKKLQELCQHTNSSWCEESWAPAHFTGRKLLTCDKCEKILKVLV